MGPKMGWRTRLAFRGLLKQGLPSRGLMTYRGSKFFSFKQRNGYFYERIPFKSNIFVKFTENGQRSDNMYYVYFTYVRIC